MGERLAISIIDAAKRLGISRTHAYAMAQRGELPTIWLGKRRLVPMAALERLLSPVVTFKPEWDEEDQALNRRGR